MRKKRIDKYFMWVGRIAMDVFKANGVYFITVADWKTDARLVYTMHGVRVSSTLEDEELFDKADSVVKRNMRHLNELAEEREYNRAMRAAWVYGASTALMVMFIRKKV